MPKKPACGLFITATNTGVGKTYVTSLIARHLVEQGVRVGVYKPVASGIGPPTTRDSARDDPYLLWQAAGRPASDLNVCPQRFRAPLAPHLAAEAENQTVDPELLRTGLEFWKSSSDIVLIEGVGGLMSPISNDDFVADLALEFGYPLLVVTANKLGVVNQTLLTLIAAATFRDGIEVAGIVVNRPTPIDDDISLDNNVRELARHCVPPILAEVGWQGEEFSQSVNWMSIAQTP